MQETEDIVTRLEQYRNGMWPVHECLRLADAWTTGVDLDDLPQWRIVVAVLAQEVREAATTIATLRAEVASLKTVMVAAAEEISAHWQAHCDAEGYGPQNLVRRLEEGIPSEYGYTAGAFAALHAEVDGLRADAEMVTKVRELLWGEHPECCGNPCVGASYGDQQELVCCGCPEPSMLNDAQIVSTLRALLPDAAIDAAKAGK